MPPSTPSAGDRAGAAFEVHYGGSDPLGADAASIRPWAEGAATLLGPAGRPPWAALDAAGIPDHSLARLRPGPSLILGMGGSALGTRAALAVASVGGGLGHEVRVLDTVDGDVVRPQLDWAQQAGAQVVVVSKSGGTLEVRALLEAALARGLRPVAFLSDPKESALGSRLRDVAPQHVHFPIPPDVGGRFSVLTAVGQVPLHLAGLPARSLLDGAAAYLDAVRADPDSSPCAAEVAWRAAHPAPGGSVVWCYSDALIPWAAWRQQLECESLGRLRDDGSRVGELVTVLRGPADQHSVAQLLLHGPQDRRVTLADFADDPPTDDAALASLASLRRSAREATADALTIPVQTITVGQRKLASLGALMAHGMLVTVLMAEYMGVSPYGQPAVEEIKRRIRWSPQ